MVIEQISGEYALAIAELHISCWSNCAWVLFNRNLYNTNWWCNEEKR